ncbi:MAG: hypothetical protein V8S27_05630 [Lachnospiraceae bacterium]
MWRTHGSTIAPATDGAESGGPSSQTPETLPPAGISNLGPGYGPGGGASALPRAGISNGPGRD